MVSDSKISPDVNCTESNTESLYSEPFLGTSKAGSFLYIVDSQSLTFSNTTYEILEIPPHSRTISEDLFDLCEGLLDPTVQTLFFKDIQSACSLMVSFTRDFTINTAMKREKSIRITVDPIDVGGSIHILGTVVDLLDHNLSQHEMKSEKERFNTIFNAAPVGLILLDREANVENASRSLSKILLKNPLEIIGERVGKALSCIKSTGDLGCGLGEMCDQCALRKTIEEVINTKNPIYNLEMEIGLKICDDVENRWVSIDADSVVVSGETKVLVAISDITERHTIAEEFKKSDFFLKETQRMAQIGTFTLDFTTGEWFPSEFLMNIFGIDDSFKGSFENWIELIHHGDREMMCHYYQHDVIDQGYDFDKEYRIVRPSDGEIRWVYSRGEVTRSEDNELISMVGTVLDITDLKNSEKETIQRESFLSAVMETSIDAIWEIDINGTVLDVNSRVIELYGFDRDEIIGHTIDDLGIVHGDSESWYTHLRERSVWQFESKHRKKSGELFDVETSVAYLDHKNGFYISFCRDISERKDTENQIIAQKKRLAESQQMAHLGSWELNIHEGKLQWSEEIFHIFELDSRTVVASYDAFLKAIHPEDRELAEATYLTSLETKLPFDITHRLLMDDGRVKYVHEHCYSEFSDDGTPLISRGTIQDITASHLIERGREELQKQLHQSQKMEAVGLLAGGVAHDFNNMLGVILGRVEELSSWIAINNPLYESVHEIEKAATRSAALTRQLLAFSRQEVIAPKRLDLNDIVEGTLSMLRRLIGENIVIDWNSCSRAMPVFVDPGQIDQILANLTVNARDAIVDAGTITIETEFTQVGIEFCKDHPGTLPGDYIKLSVGDSGSGMDWETQHKIFEPFFTTKGEGKGTGLGLSTVYGIVQQNGGAITVDSIIDEGTTFSIYFPCDDGEIVQSVERAVSKDQLKGTETVLLVEDEEMLLHTLERVLKRHGYTVIAVGIPEDALEIVDERNDIDLLITDVIMPVINGRELADEIMKSLPDIQTLFMSGYTANHITEFGSDDEAIHFIQKPFQFNDFLHKIRETLL